MLPQTCSTDSCACALLHAVPSGHAMQHVLPAPGLAPQPACDILRADTGRGQGVEKNEEEAFK
jgi:hypothetical protein